MSAADDYHGGPTAHAVCASCGKWAKSAGKTLQLFGHWKTSFRCATCGPLVRVPEGTAYAYVIDGSLREDCGCGTPLQRGMYEIVSLNADGTVTIRPVKSDEIEPPTGSFDPKTNYRYAPIYSPVVAAPEPEVPAVSVGVNPALVRRRRFDAVVLFAIVCIGISFLCRVAQVVLHVMERRR